MQPRPDNVAQATPRGQETIYKVLDQTERQRYENEWAANEQRKRNEQPEVDKRERLKDPWIVSYFNACASYFPDIQKRAEYEAKLVAYINEVEAASDYDTLNWM